MKSVLLIRNAGLPRDCAVRHVPRSNEKVRHFAQNLQTEESF